MNYVVVYEKSGTGWSAYVPDLPGVVTTGASKENVKELIREAIEFHLEGLREDNLPIPEPVASAEVVTVS
jgi:predicted RNase H-like HicB family nuclease